MIRLLKCVLLFLFGICSSAQADDPYLFEQSCHLTARLGSSTPILQCEDSFSFIHLEPFNMGPGLTWSDFSAYIQTQDISADVGPEHMSHFFALRDSYDRATDSVGFDFLNALQFEGGTQDDPNLLRVYETKSYLPLVGIEKLIYENAPTLRTPDPQGGHVFVMLGSLHGSPIAVMYWAGGPLNATKAHIFYQIYVWS